MPQRAALQCPRDLQPYSGAFCGEPEPVSGHPRGHVHHGGLPGPAKGRRERLLCPGWSYQPARLAQGHRSGGRDQGTGTRRWRGQREVFDRITRDVSIAMESGDILLLYTDGVDEATDHKGLLFGVERIKETLAEAAPDGPQAVVNLLCDTVNRFKGGEPQADDITIVTVARK
nr:SpoIIE family protein phosphatase [Verrucomicrobium spinosum]